MKDDFCDVIAVGRNVDQLRIRSERPNALDLRKLGRSRMGFGPSRQFIRPSQHVGSLDRDKYFVRRSAVGVLRHTPFVRRHLYRFSAHGAQADGGK
ncbi:hypothetical protein WK10_10550 [Burkholderia ubonensis]|nr:hypothetical protein WK10_10550 [Burkholderia ubonensis]KVZ38258.1 hypothetical protein WL17_17240 [Burkholderia ubonensis]